MADFASIANWPLTHPSYDTTRNVCTCPTPLLQVWIAPGDLVSMYGPELPASFRSEYADAYGLDEHVKVCITREQLMGLWNANHCHDVNTSEPFLGYDGDLLCFDLSQFCPSCREGNFAKCAPPIAERCFQDEAAQPLEPIS